MATNFYLLIEESARELLSRLLLARLAVERGHRVVLGPQWWFWANFDRLPPGVALFKGNNAIQTRNMVAARTAGHRIASIEEEAFGSTDEAELLREFDPAVGDACDLMAVQGEVHYRFLSRRFPQAAQRIKTTGNPRSDLLHPRLVEALFAEQCRTLRADGKFILFNTNYPISNPADGDTLRQFDRAVTVGYLSGEGHAERAYFDAWCDWERHNFEIGLRVLGALSRNGCPLPVVVRPHPSENQSFWHELVRGCANVRVEAQGPHHAWTLASSLVVHTSCTTGLEAFLLGRPALSIRSPKPGRDDGFLSNLVSHLAYDDQTAVDWIVAAIGRSDPIADERAAFQRSMAEHLSYCGQSGQVLLDHLEALGGSLPGAAAVSELSNGHYAPAPVSQRQARKFRDMDKRSIADQFRALQSLAGRPRAARFEMLGPFVHLVAPANGSD